MENMLTSSGRRCNMHMKWPENIAVPLPNAVRRFTIPKKAVNQYQVGDIVWLLQEARQVGECQKLIRVYECPYLVIRKYSDINFFLQLDGRGKTKPAHHNKLKPYKGDKAPRSVQKVKRQMASHRSNRD